MIQPDEADACAAMQGVGAEVAPVDGMGAPGKEQPVEAPSSPAYSPASPANSPTSPVHAPASPTYGPLSPEREAPSSPAYSPASPAYSPTSPVHAPASSTYGPLSPEVDPPSPHYTPCSPTPKKGQAGAAGAAAGEANVDAPQTAEDCLIMLDGEPGMSPSLRAYFPCYHCAHSQQIHSNLCCLPILGGFSPLTSNAGAGLSA